jgi:hypothetical protein
MEVGVDGIALGLRNEDHGKYSYLTMKTDEELSRSGS